MGKKHDYDVSIQIQITRPPKFDVRHGYSSGMLTIAALACYSIGRIRVGAALVQADMC